MKISRQLNLGLSIILLFVTILGIISVVNANRLWLNTKELYEHPLTVRRALGDIRKNIDGIRLELFSMVDETEKAGIIVHTGTIAALEADSLIQIGVVRERYLGPRTDVEALSDLLARWRPIREELIRLLESGRPDEAQAYLLEGGVSSRHAENLIVSLDVINEFALRKGDAFYTDAQEQRNRAIAQLCVLFATVLMLSGLISLLLRNAISIPLRLMTMAANKFRAGDMDARSGYQSGNEFGTLSVAINEMVGSIQSELKSRENLAQITAGMMIQDDLHRFCQGMISALMTHSDARMAALYLLNDKKTEFVLFESIGLQDMKKTGFSATNPEGEFGLTVATREIQRITGLSKGPSHAFVLAEGVLLPSEVWTIPILSGEEVIAVVSLSFLHEVSQQEARLLHDVWGAMNARLSGTLAFQQNRDISLVLRDKNMELEAQAKELAMQTDELVEQNIELEMQKRMLDEAGRLKSSFLSNMSHELRTPLNSVIALASVLGRRLRGVIPEDEYGYLEVIERNGKHLLSLVNDILDISRIESGKEEINIGRFSVRDLVQETMEIVAPQVGEKEVVLLNHVGTDLPLLTTDKSMCRHVLMNLIGNALKFTREGSVEVSAVAEGEFLLISVRDTGIGISADKLQFIFDEFRQADESTARKYGGTGLGLSIAKKYAELLHGSVLVDSVPDAGSTFTFRVPLTIGVPVDRRMEDASDGWQQNHQPSLSTPAQRVAACAGGEIKGKCILLVEDSEPAIIQMKDILMEEGYRLLIARNGREALEVLGKVVPDAMILDLMMPDVDGFQVLKIIREEGKCPEVPVLILTAKHVTKEELSFLKGNHIHQLIQKGTIGKDELLDSVRSMVSPIPAEC